LLEVAAPAAMLIQREELPLDQHPAAVYLASLSVRSRRTIGHDLNVIARLVSGDRCDAFTLDWGALRYAHTAAVRAALAARYSHTGANRMLSALRGVLKAAWRLGQIEDREYQRAIDIPTVKGQSLPRGRALSGGELRALFQVCAADAVTTAATDAKPARSRAQSGGARDAALLAVLYGAGLRRSEVVALDCKDYDTQTGTITVRSGKGNKDRIGYATHGSRRAIEAWLVRRAEQVGQLAGPLFLPMTKNGRLQARRMTDQNVLAILTKRARQAGLAHVSPHDLRRTFISDLLDAGADIATVQKLAGHANVSTTASYDRRGEAAKLKAAELLHVPFAG